MLNQSKIDAMRQQLKTGVQVVSAPQLFPTPKELAERMAEEILGGYPRAANNFRILEPSAGTGVLIGACGASWYPGGEFVAVEINHRLANDLESEFPLTMVTNRNFLEVDNLGLFDRIIMNPPFINGADIKHIKHAAMMLQTGGILVAICAGGPRQKRELEPLASLWEPLPSGTFKDQGTNVNAVLMTIEQGA